MATMKGLPGKKARMFESRACCQIFEGDDVHALADDVSRGVVQEEPGAGADVAEDAHVRGPGDAVRVGSQGR